MNKPQVVTIYLLTEILWCKLLVQNAILPSKSSSGAAGFDLYSVDTKPIPVNKSTIIRTGIQIKLPRNTYGRIAPRSSLAYNFQLDVFAGVIDRDYTGEIQVIMFNFGNNLYNVNAGDRIAQLICEKISYPNIKLTTSLPETERGCQGFGSSGL